MLEYKLCAISISGANRAKFIQDEAGFPGCCLVGNVMTEEMEIKGGKLVSIFFHKLVCRF